MYVRARYGHGARLGYNKEWRMNKEFLAVVDDDQDLIIDLSRIFLGEFDKVKNFKKLFEIKC